MKEIGSLVAGSHLFGILLARTFALELFDACNLGESFLAQRAGVFTLRPCFNATKAKFVLAAVNGGEFLGRNIAHADAAVDAFFGSSGSSRFLLSVARVDFSRSHCRSRVGRRLFEARFGIVVRAGC